MAPQTTHPICVACGDRVGVYERVLAEMTDGATLTTSLVNLGPVRPTLARLWHIGCASEPPAAMNGRIRS